MPFGQGPPNVQVFDLRYASTDDVLVAGTLGRGAWTLPQASEARKSLTPPSPPAPPSPAAPDRARVQQHWLRDQLLLPPLSTPQARASPLQAVQAWFVFASPTEPFPPSQALFAKEAALLVDRALNATARAQGDAEVPTADPLHATPSGFVLATLEGAMFSSTVVGGQG